MACLDTVVIQQVKEVEHRHQKKAFYLYVLLCVMYLSWCAGNIFYAFGQRGHLTATVEIHENESWALPTLNDTSELEQAVCSYGGVSADFSSWRLVVTHTAETKRGGTPSETSGFKPNTTFLEWFTAINSSECSPLMEAVAPFVGPAQCVVFNASEIVDPKVTPGSTNLYIRMLMKTSSSQMADNVYCLVTDETRLDLICKPGFRFQGKQAIPTFALRRGNNTVRDRWEGARVDMSMSKTKQLTLFWNGLRSKADRILRSYDLIVTPYSFAPTPWDIQNCFKNVYPVLDKHEARRMYGEVAKLDWEGRREGLWDTFCYPRILDAILPGSAYVNIVTRQTTRVITSIEKDPVNWFNLLSNFGGSWQYVGLLFTLLFVGANIWGVRRPCCSSVARSNPRGQGDSPPLFRSMALELNDLQLSRKIPKLSDDISRVGLLQELHLVNHGVVDHSASIADLQTRLEDLERIFRARTK